MICPAMASRPRQQAHQRRLSRAILADQNIDSPAANAKGDILQRKLPAVLLGHPARFQHNWMRVILVCALHASTSCRRARLTASCHSAIAVRASSGSGQDEIQSSCSEATQIGERRPPSEARPLRTMRRQERKDPHDPSGRPGAPSTSACNCISRSFRVAPPSACSAGRSPASCSMAWKTSAPGIAIDSTAASARCAARLLRFSPQMMPRAALSQCGAPSPSIAGTKYTPPVSVSGGGESHRVFDGIRQSQELAYPLYRGATHRNVALQSILRWFPGDPPGNRRRQS